MNKILSGTELVGYIQERQLRQVRALRQAHKIFPKLAIVRSQHISDPIDVYIRMKERYGHEIFIETEVFVAHEDEMSEVLKRLNSDDSVHAIIVQLPLQEVARTDEIINQIAPHKDVDGLGKAADFYSATAMAVDWLLASYSVDLKEKKITILGNGRLVGAPLARLWRGNGLNVTVIDSSSDNVVGICQNSNIIVTATGTPGVITSDMVNPDTVLVDAGTASENGVLLGDVSEDVRERNDITMTPEKGGVGPLTIAMLFEHVIQAATKLAKKK